MQNLLLFDCVVLLQAIFYGAKTQTLTAANLKGFTNKFSIILKLWVIVLFLFHVCKLVLL